MESSIQLPFNNATKENIENLQLNNRNEKGFDKKSLTILIFTLIIYNIRCFVRPGVFGGRERPIFQ